MAAKRKTDKFKRKKWFSLISPKAFGEKEMGETPATKKKQVIGRTVRVSLDKLTGQRKQRHINATFKVSEVKENNAFTKIVGFEVNTSYLRKIVRRRASKIQAIEDATTKDEKKIRVSAIAVCRRRVEKRKEKEIRKIITNELSKGIPKKNFEQAMQEMMFGIMGRKIYKKIKEIEGIRKLEITKSKLLEGKG